MMTRFTLNAHNAEHVYEWLRLYWASEPDRFGGCAECAQIGRRLERFIGPAAVRRIARLINTKSHGSLVRDRPGQPVDAVCAIRGCQLHVGEVTHDDAVADALQPDSRRSAGTD